MSSQHLADILLAQWTLLWPLPPAERMARIEQTRLDYEFEMHLGAVHVEMSNAQA